MRRPVRAQGAARGKSSVTRGSANAIATMRACRLRAMLPRLLAIRAQMSHRCSDVKTAADGPSRRARRCSVGRSSCQGAAPAR